MNRPLIALGLALVLGLVGWLIAAKEATLVDGRLVLLELAPVDPRSLMQGDYMILRYAITDRIDFQDPPWPDDGRVVLGVAPDGVGALRRLDDGRPLADDEVRLRYRVRARRTRLGAESYFFEEGSAELYVDARYGGLRVAPDGDSVLVGLFGRDRRPLGETRAGAATSVP